MKFELLLVSVLTLSFSAPVLAVCAGGSKTIFYCTSTQGKQIEVCDSDVTITYSFGRPQSKPEIVVRVLRPLVSTWQGNRGERWHTYSIDIPNGNTTYNVFWGHDAQLKNAPPEAGVNVLTSDRVVTTVLCQPKGIVQALKGIDLREDD